MSSIKKRIDINYFINKFMTDGLKLKKNLFNFLEINNINDYISDKIWFMEHSNLKNDNYTYFVDGGLSWFYNLKKYNFTYNEKIQLLICNLKFYYIFNNKKITIEKLKDLYNFTIDVQNFIKINTNINTQLITTNFSYIDNYFIFNDNPDSSLSQNILNIKLILKTDSKDINDSNDGSSSSFINFKPKRFRKRNLSIINNQIVLEFTLEYIEKYIKISDFKNAYVIFPKNNNYIINENPLIVRKKLNRLNMIGLISYNYIHLGLIDDVSGLNIAKLRENIYIKYYLDTPTKYIHFFKTVLDVYKKNYKSTYLIFIQKINENIINTKYPYFSNHINIINRYYIAKIRPIINSTILNINNELHKYNTSIFIKGGDSLRRYNKDISFTSDIDVRLYYNNNYDNITKIIINNLFKLRCYIEDNKNIIFNDKYLFKLKKNNIEITIENIKDNTQNLITKHSLKSDKNGLFDLYTIAIEYFIHINDISNQKKPINLYKSYTLLPILDISCQENKEDFNKYYKIIDRIPIATVDYLINDIENIYIDNPNLVYRIVEDKIEKDLKRYNFLIDYYNSVYIKPKDKYEDIKKIKGLSKSIMYIISKYRKNESFTTNDYTIIFELLKKKANEISKYPLLSLFFNDIINFKINLPNEKLNETNRYYDKYNYNKTKNFINKKYLDFYKKSGDITILIKNFTYLTKSPKNPFKFKTRNREKK